MDRRAFVKLTGIGMGGLMLPITGTIVSAAELVESGMDFATKKKLANIALNAATASGATYADARIGRYLNQFITAQEKRVNNVVNTLKLLKVMRRAGVGKFVFSGSCSTTTCSAASRTD